MARIYPLFSSSSGNSSFIGSPREGILIDAGVSCRKLMKALEQNEIPASAVKAIFVTHDHSDHISGLKVFTKSTGVPVYSAPKTMDWLLKNEHISSNGIHMTVGSNVTVGDFSITSFKTPHDAVESVGYRVITPDGKSVCVCTDLGHVTEEAHRSLLGCDLVLLESNYDERMLRSGSYPFILKQRIASDHGHLSNVASSKEIKGLVESGLTRVVIGHLSRENNTPQIAVNTIRREMGEDIKENRDYLLYVAPVETVGMAVTF